MDLGFCSLLNILNIVKEQGLGVTLSLNHLNSFGLSQSFRMCSDFH